MSKDTIRQSIEEAIEDAVRAKMESDKMLEYEARMAIHDIMFQMVIDDAIRFSASPIYTFIPPFLHNPL